MKSFFIASFSLLFIPITSEGTLNRPINYNPESNKSYHNKELHIYDNKKADRLTLTGNSALTLNAGAFISNTIAKDSSNIYLYNLDNDNQGIPIIKNTEIKGKSTLTLEKESLSIGNLIVDKGAKLNIKHIEDEGENTSASSPTISGNVYIENLNLAGKVFISPSSELETEYNNADYQKPLGKPVITNISNLTMQPGSILSMKEYAPRMQFNQLQIDKLSGSGIFIMNSHLAGGVGDKIIINDHASGHFGLWVIDSGYESPTRQSLDLIAIHSGDAHFDLLNRNGIVEVGVWQYTLQHETTDDYSYWYLANKEKQSLAESKKTDIDSIATSSIDQPSTSENQDSPHVAPSSNLTKYHGTTPIMSRSARAALNMASASRHILTTELGGFHQRIDESSNRKGSLSLWAHHLKDNSHLTSHHGTSFQTHLQGIQIGVDKNVELNNGSWLLGTFISDSRTTVHSEMISNGTIKSQSGGLYTTWLDHSGFYWDNVFKYNYLRHEVRTKMNSNQLTKGHYHQHGLSFASEVGLPIHWTHALTLTPYGKVSYFRTNKVTHTLDNGLATTLNSAYSVDGEAGLLLEAPFSLAEHHIRPYLKTAISHELIGNNKIIINKTTFNLPDTGTRGKYGLGSRWDITENLSAYAEVDYQKGHKIKSPINTSLAIKINI